jgi:BNR repeat-like domain
VRDVVQAKCRVKSKRRLLLAATAFVAVGSAFVAAQVASAGKQSSLSTTKVLPLSNTPVSGGVIVAQAVHAGALKPATTPVQASIGASSPQGSRLGNVQASPGTAPVNEVPITADPKSTRRLHLATGGNDYSCSSIQGFYTSFDGGSTWPDSHCLRVLAGFEGLGDPVVAYDLTRNLYAFGIDADSSGLNGRIVFEKSADNGATWSLPAVAVSPLFSGGLTDKPWVESDHGAASPQPGALYVSVTQINSSFSSMAISVSRSYDGGATWSTFQVGPTVSLPTVDQFSDLAVGPDGTIYLTWMRCSATGPTGDCGGSTASMLFSKSTDGGTTWANPVVMVTGVHLAPDTCGAFYGCVPGTDERVSNIPVVDIDNSTGALYVVYDNYNGTNLQAIVIKSTDGGATWGPTVAVWPAGTHDQFFPWLSVRADGLIGVTALWRTTGTEYLAKAAVSRNGGASFGDKVRMSAVKSDTLNDGFGGTFLGDYIGNIWYGAYLHASWPDTRTGVAADEVGGMIP